MGEEARNMNLFGPAVSRCHAKRCKQRVTQLPYLRDAESDAATLFPHLEGVLSMKGLFYYES
jgi:hypothetical protein